MPTSPKETPASGSNHAAGVNTQNTAAIVNDLAAPSNTPATDYVRDLAKSGAVRLLTKASLFAKLHAPQTLWTRRMGTGAAALLVRLEWPGVLCVYDPRTGDKLATSAPGQPETLQ